MNSDEKRSQWTEKQVGDEIELCYGKGLIEKERINGKIPVFGSNGIVGFHNKPLVNGPGVIIGRKGSVGEVKFSFVDFWAIDTTYFLKLKKRGDIRFWYYFLLTLQLNKMNSHSAVPGLNRKAVYEITKKIPEYPEQQIIADFLAILDSKIDLNERMNRTLEAIGEALFKRWFVDFEFPNQEGKPYKSTGGKMVQSELGEIPSGWEIGGLGNICDITMGQSPPGETYNERGDGTPFFQGIRDFGFRFPSKRVYCTAPTRFANERDALLSVRAPVGSLNMAEERLAIGRGIAALHLKDKPGGFLYYLLMTTRSAWNTYEAEGTVFGSATKQDVHNFKILIPPKSLREKFGQFIEPLDAKILLNEKESRTLTALRDSLLPKLMSGKIRVPLEKPRFYDACR